MATGLRALLRRADAVLLPLPRAAAVRLSIPPSGAKCVSEEIQANVVVLADHTVVYEDDSHGAATISAKGTELELQKL